MSKTSERGSFLARLTSDDAVSGLMFAAVGAFGLWVGQDYPVGTAIRMGPGYVPRALCLILVVLGVLIVLSALAVRPPPSEPPPFRVVPLLLIPLAVVVFAFALVPLGLVAATALLVLIAAFADKGQRPIEIIGALVFLTLLTVGVFVWGVGIPLRLWPEL